MSELTMMGERKQYRVSLGMEGITKHEVHITKPFAFDVGQLVEIVESGDDDYNGIRLRVMTRERDDEGNRLYGLGINEDAHCVIPNWPEEHLYYVNAWWWD